MRTIDGYSPSLNEILPNVILEFVSTTQTLYEMFYRILRQTEKIRAGYRIGVLPATDLIRCFDDGGPGASGRSSNNGLLRRVCSNYLEFGTVTSI
jgi:hypothetical protein